MENQAKWQFVNPEGLTQIEESKVNPHPGDLTGKTVLLRWNGKHNGDVFLNRIGELITEEVKDVKVIKAWEVHPSTKMAEQKSEASKATARMLAELKPDIVIGSQAD